MFTTSIKGVTIVLIEKGIEASLIPHGGSDRPAEEIVQIVRDHQEALEQEAGNAMLPLAVSLDSQLRQIDSGYGASVDRSEAHNHFWFKGQIVTAARQHGYFADTITYRTWVRL